RYPVRHAGRTAVATARLDRLLLTVIQAPHSTSGPAMTNKSVRVARRRQPGCSWTIFWDDWNPFGMMGGAQRYPSRPVRPRRRQIHGEVLVVPPRRGTVLGSSVCEARHSCEAA